MENEKINQAYCVLEAYLNPSDGHSGSASHEQIIEAENRFHTSFPELTDTDWDNIISKYEQIHPIKTFVDECTLTDPLSENDNWLEERKEYKNSEDFAYSKRYSAYLSKKVGEDSAQHIRKSAEHVLSLCANPNGKGNKRGLVRGDVQSGKTANYLGLASLAADYGYKLILILAGLTESLRVQTQQRVDEGLVGLISSTIAEGRYDVIGVGKPASILNLPFFQPFTTDKNDFEKCPVSLSSLNKPSVLVVKKNKKILSSIIKWLGIDKISIPNNILIIDDECDNASINTREDDNPSAINKLIREIYNCFSCATYVGYTATPFANILINPDAIIEPQPSKAIIGEDLFPKDFIVRLHADKGSYFGFDEVFNDSSIGQHHIEILSPDESMFLQAKHKKDDPYNELSQSLKEAILNFLICNCVRTLRGDEKEHRTRRINISRFNKKHREISWRVEDYLKEIKNSVDSSAYLDLNYCLENSIRKQIFNIYRNDSFYRQIRAKYSFEEIKRNLPDEIEKMEVAVINNSMKKDDRFNYDQCPDGARVIVVGGLVLSRGLTLSGLRTSYYSRNTQAYDALLQRCRWFGYRPNYADLCRVFRSQDSLDCFETVNESIEDLDDQLTQMDKEKKSPEDFGLMIRERPETLNTKLRVTARNKLGAGVSKTMSINYSGQEIDVSKLFADKERNERNIQAVQGFLKSSSDNGYIIEQLENRLRIRNLPASFVGSLLRDFNIASENKRFDFQILKGFFEGNSNLKTWDVLIADGDENNTNCFTLFNGRKVHNLIRTFTYNKDSDLIRISGGKNRVLSPNRFAAGLDKITLDTIVRKNREERIKRQESMGRSVTETYIAEDYLKVDGRKPLLIIMPISLRNDSKTKIYVSELEKNHDVSINNTTFISIGIGFPGSKGKECRVNYCLNKIKQKELEQEEEDEDELE